MRDDGRRARIMAAVTEQDATAGPDQLRTAVLVRGGWIALSGCALRLMSGAESASALGGAVRPDDHGAADGPG